MNKDKYPEGTVVGDTHPELPIDPDVVQPGAYKWPPHFTPSFVFIVFIGGCVGTYARYWVGQELQASSWPTATLVVNLFGAFLLGLLLESLARLGKDEGTRRIVRLAIGTGFMGAFTTYSSFAVDAHSLAQQGSYLAVFAYIAATIVGGLIATTAGISIATVHHKRRAAK